MLQVGWRLRIKRAFDVVVAALGLCLTFPIIVVIALGILLTSGRPVLFRQMRPGQFGRPIQVLKFRSMREALSSAGTSLPDAERITRFGKFLRMTSLDELPQFWNVLRGDLSLVGPRPLLMEYLDRYSPDQFRRHEVLPGITGWAQVNGRNASAWEHRFDNDLWYVDNWSLLLDLKILILTCRRIARPSGISEPGHATKSKFVGGSDSGS